MALSIKNPEAEKLVRQVSDESGENITQTIIHALEDKLERLRGRKSTTDLYEEIIKISRRCSSTSDKDKRSAEEILGYNKRTGGLK